jgi:hypothetical protein
MPSTSQDNNFAEKMRDSVDEVKMSSSTLDNAIEWIKDNLNPGDVFEEKKLLEFAAGYMPNDVFPEIELRKWAEDNGYTKITE